MVRLRGMPRGGPQGRGMGRPMPRHMRPEPPILPPFGIPRGRLIRGHPVRPGPPRLPPPRMAPPPPGLGLPPPLPPRRLSLPIPPHPPIPPRDLPPPIGRRPLPPPPVPRRPGLRMPPMPMPMPPMPPNLRRPMRPGPPFARGRGGIARRGVKRLGTSANGRSKKSQKRKEKTEEMELSKPWVTEALKVEIHKKYQLYEIAKEKKTDTDWQAYKDQRILVGKMTNTAKLEYVGSHPEAGEFFCESCDRGFKTPELLEAHIGEHQVCGRDGCKFEAHPKIVEKHVQLQHETGLYHRIVFTQNPEDVAKWIAERKSRYPTKENMEKKEAQNSEMIERGERIPKQGKPFNNRETPVGRQDRKRRQNSVATNVDGQKKQKTRLNHRQSKDETKWKDPEAWRGGLPKFPGTAAFPHIKDEPPEVCEENHFSDDESEVTREKTVECIDKPLVSNVLASLMLNYGSDTEEEPSETPVLKGQNNTVVAAEDDKLFNSTHENNTTNGLPVSQFIKQEVEDPDSGPEEAGVQREDMSNQPVPKPDKEDKLGLKQPVKTEKPEHVQNLRPKPPTRPPMKRYQLSLLEKLLQNEIRHERNIILQCVRYVVKNNFFGCGSTK